MYLAKMSTKLYTYLLKITIINIIHSIVGRENAETYLIEKWYFNNSGMDLFSIASSVKKIRT